MIIAVNTTSFLKDDFIYEAFTRIVNLHPEHSFIFIVDNTPEPWFKFPSNTTIVENEKPASLLQRLVSPKDNLPSILRKYKADVLICDKPFSSAIKIPVCLLASDALNKENKKLVQKAKIVVTDSQFSKQNIIDNYKIGENKVDVVYPSVADEFNATDILEREKIKEQYAEGNEYFLAKGIDEEKSLVNILKAFSSFKKWQKSKMQLLVEDDATKNYEESLRLYKYRSEVKLLKHLSKNELVKVTASAYAIIYVSATNKFALPVLETMRSAVPIITSNTSSIHETCSDAALYANTNDTKELSEKMMLLFKDEKLRSELIEKGLMQSKKFSWNKTAESLWQSILKTTL